MTATTRLSSQIVHIISIDCFFRGDEDNTSRVIGEGIGQVYGYHPERLESHRDEVFALLLELPEAYRASSPDQGGHFNNACVDRHGDLWTGEHAIMDRLIALGHALGLVRYMFPIEIRRQEWAFWYFQILDVPTPQNDS